MNEAYEVDLDNKTCSCRLWQLNGYGCVHSVACICFLNGDVESFVDPMYSPSTYMKSYQHGIRGMNGSVMWPETEYIPPLPPQERRMPGRPQTKRRKDVVENQTRHSLSKAGKKGKCSVCKLTGHNKKTCPQVDRPEQDGDEEQFEADMREADLAAMADEIQQEVEADIEQMAAAGGMEDQMGDDDFSEGDDDFSDRAYEMALTPPLMDDLSQIDNERDGGMGIGGNEGDGGMGIGGNEGDGGMGIAQGNEGDGGMGIAQGNEGDGGMGIAQGNNTAPVPGPVPAPDRGRSTLKMLLQKIREGKVKRSERIMKLKLKRRIGGPDAPGNSMKKALQLD